MDNQGEEEEHPTSLGFEKKIKNTRVDPQSSNQILQTKLQFFNMSSSKRFSTLFLLELYEMDG